MSEQTDRPTLPAAMLGALGIVYGDLGTSPLYTMQTILQSTGSAASGHAVPTASIIGVMSLIAWSLLLIVSIKYGVFVMMADNNGEGGIFALTALVSGTRKAGHKARRKVGRKVGRKGQAGRGRGAGIMIVIGLIGGALLFGDGILTPAISVLSAVEGVKVATPALRPFVMPIAVVILIGLFCLQTVGTKRIGVLFGPIMLLWFITIGGFGAHALIAHPQVIRAIDPRYAIAYLVAHGWNSLVVLGSVFLSVTGSEALYADMGHVGRRPIRVAWYAIVLPALLLSYAGQSALLIGLKTPPENPFFGVVPSSIRPWAIWPIVLLATFATIIASQAIITGVFSMTRQAMQLGWSPGLSIRQTSDKEYGQIYVPAVNWTMMACTVAITAAFGSSSSLSGAYGVAVSTTMLLTTALLFSYLHGRADWPLPVALAVVVVFLAVDSVFFVSNLLKFFKGGYVPLAVGAAVFLMMSTWRRGIAALKAKSATDDELTPQAFLDQLAVGEVPRVPGVIVFLARMDEPIPRTLISHVEQFGALQRTVITLTVRFEEKPRVGSEDRLTLQSFEGGVWHLVVRFGFVEIPDLLGALALAHERGFPVVPDDGLFMVAADEVVRNRTLGQIRLRSWRRIAFSFMYRNAVHSADRFRLPANRVVQVGRLVGL